MCFHSPKMPAPQQIAMPPTAGPAVLDSQAVAAATNDRARRRLAYSRQNTILAGNQAGGAAPPTMPVKTALGG